MSNKKAKKDKNYLGKRFLLEVTLMISIFFIALSFVFLFLGYTRYIIGNIEMGEIAFSQFWVYAGIVFGFFAAAASFVANLVNKQKLGNWGMWIFLSSVCSYVVLGLNIITLLMII